MPEIVTKMTRASEYLPPTNSSETFHNWAELLEAWLALTSVKDPDNLLILMLFNQWLPLTMLRITGP